MAAVLLRRGGDSRDTRAQRDDQHKGARERPSASQGEGPRRKPTPSTRNVELYLQNWGKSPSVGKACSRLHCYGSLSKGLSLVSCICSSISGTLCAPFKTCPSPTPSQSYSNHVQVPDVQHEWEQQSLPHLLASAPSRAWLQDPQKRSLLPCGGEASLSASSFLP